MNITRSEYLGQTTISLKLEHTDLKVIIQLVPNSDEVELLWTSPMDRSQRQRFRFGHRFAGTLDHSHDFLELLTKAIDIADRIKAGTFDIQTIPEEPKSAEVDWEAIKAKQPAPIDPSRKKFSKKRKVFEN